MRCLADIGVAGRMGSWMYETERARLEMDIWESLASPAFQAVTLDEITKWVSEGGEDRLD